MKSRKSLKKINQDETFCPQTLGNKLVVQSLETDEDFANMVNRGRRLHRNRTGIGQKKSKRRRKNGPLPKSFKKY